MKNKKILILVEAALCVALATVLSLVKFEFQFGGSITLVSMLPIAVLSYRRGLGVGVAAGFVSSLVQLLLGLNNLAWATTPVAVIAIIAFDYLLPFTAIGFAGMFRNLNKTGSRPLHAVTFCSGLVTVMLLRYICHIFSGAIVWYSLTVGWGVDEGSLIEKFINHPWIYSIVYNGLYMIPEIITTTIVGAILASFLCFRNEKFAFGKQS